MAADGMEAMTSNQPPPSKLGDRGDWHYFGIKFHAIKNVKMLMNELNEFHSY